MVVLLRARDERVSQIGLAHQRVCNLQPRLMLRNIRGLCIHLLTAKYTRRMNELHLSCRFFFVLSDISLFL